ncbi:MerC family mercury resistance protein [Aquibaculum sediminis]|uniref:MerC family mercury resistance protein n=1 Tax=Aquibaculum sediminis TaxID=3231907 RepID=UPI0034551297
MIQRLRAWAAPAATIMSLIACYGTLAAIALLGALGATIALNQAVWAGAIVIFAWLALLALLLRYRQHRRFLPIVIAAVGVILITYTMTISYDRIIELVGFAFLCGGTLLDLRRGESVRRHR